MDWIEHGFGGKAAANWLDGRPVASLRQTHSADVRRVSQPGERVDSGDALLTASPRVWITVRTADCVPVILADEGHRAVAVVHAGWRGTVAGVVERAIEEMKTAACTRVEEVRAAVGPAIGGCCYEVGPEVAARFARWFPEREDLCGRVRIDLREAVARQLAALGVGAASVDRADLCTCCGGEEFESFRRDGERAGRMVAGVMIK